MNKEIKIDGIWYRLDIDKQEAMVIKSLGDEYSNEIIIPSSFFFEGIIYRVTIIGEYAFEGCYHLYSIAIPDSVMSIYPHAFGYCSRLAEVHVNSIETWCNIEFKEPYSNPFVNCSDEPYARNTTNLYIQGKIVTELIIPATVNTIRKSAFVFYEGLTSVTILDGVKGIECNAFYGCTNLKSMTISDTVTHIGDSAFEGCFNLKSVKLSNNITRIGKNTFRDCPNLVSVIGGGNVKHIDDYAFCNCKNLSTFNIPNNVETIGNYAFEDCYHLSIILPQNLISIGKYAFEKCSLESIKIPKSVTSIDRCALQGCYSENDSIIVEDGNPIYDSRENCNAIIETNTNTLVIGGNSTIIPNSVKTIGENAFMNCFRYCNMWYSVTIPDGVECIEKHAFSGCYKLDSITIPDSVVTIGESAFNNCVNLGSVYINSLESWCNIDFGVGANPLSHKHFDFYNMGTAHLIVNGKLVHELNIPNTVKSIKNFAFERCSLTSVFIPENVTTIGIEAFAWCSSLKSVVISNSMTSIGNSAFCACSLASILLPKSVEIVGRSAFHGCNEATYVTILGNPTILQDAFAKCDKIRDVYCYSEKVVQADGAFGGIDLSLVTLHVPANMIDQYKNAMPWCNFGSMVPLQ